jgi:glycosyltransferase involved in cell wall biosynthesis
MVKENKIFFMCSGVGHINRGYEVHMRELFDQISDKIPEIQFILLKGKGNSSKNEKTIWCIRRNSKFSNFCKKIFKIHPPLLELLTFFLSSIYYILRYKPKVIYCADYMLSAFLYKFKKAFRFKFNILFLNGNGYLPPYRHWHFTHQPLKIFNTIINDQYQFFIPHGLDTEKFIKKTESKYDLRIKLSLPIEKRIILSVGKIDYSHKRMHYLIEEFSVALNYNHNLFLLIIGAYNPESKTIILLANKLLPPTSFRFLEVPFNQIISYYFASDIFCLSSINEGFGLVYIEALLSGLPVIADDNKRTREVMGNFGIFKNLNNKGELSKTLINSDYEFNPKDSIQFIIKNYEWDNLINLYIGMFTTVLSK